MLHVNNFKLEIKLWSTYLITILLTIFIISIKIVDLGLAVV